MLGFVKRIFRRDAEIDAQAAKKKAEIQPESCGCRCKCRHVVIHLPPHDHHKRYYYNVNTVLVIPCDELFGE